MRVNLHPKILSVMISLKYQLHFFKREILITEWKLSSNFKKEVNKNQYRIRRILSRYSPKEVLGFQENASFSSSKNNRFSRFVYKCTAVFLNNRVIVV